MENPDKNPKNAKPESNADPAEQKPERAPNWITDMYDKMNIPVRTLDIALIVLGVLIVLLFVFGNRIQLGI